MFAKRFSKREYDPLYWPFLLRFETTAVGFVDAAKNYLDGASDAEMEAFLEKCVAKCFDVAGNVVPPGWWDGIEIPSIQWFNEYFRSELPAMIAEIKRGIAEKKAAKNASEFEAGSAPPPADVFDPIDREKIRRLAHRNQAFRDYLLRSNGGADKID